MEDTRKNLFLGLGTMLTALSASLCCIVPLAAAVLGAGSAALATRMEPLRPWFLSFTVLLLGSGFYRAYRTEPCAPVSRRRTRAILWTVTALAAALTAFPHYASSLTQALATGEKPASVTALFHVEGMTCGGCESGVRLKLAKLHGVESVDASYEKRQARVTYNPRVVTPERIIGALAELGYSASPRSL
jgi:mercuric ion transport protein